MDSEYAWDSLLDIDSFNQLLKSLYSPGKGGVEQLLNDIYQGKQIFTLDYFKETIQENVLYVSEGKYIWNYQSNYM